MTDLTDAGTPRPSFLDPLGPRSTQRAAPRASIALAGAGCALAVAGVLVLAGDAGDRADGSFNRVPGTLLSLLVVAAGLVALHLARRGPLATAGAVALAGGIPATIGFLVVGGHDGRLDTVVALAALAWLVAYAVGPGRGRPVLLGLGLYGVWSTVLQVVGGGSVLTLPGLAPLGLLTFGESRTYDSFSDTSELTSTGPFGGLGGSGGFDEPDWAALGLVSLIVGVGYLLVSRRLDRQGRNGMSGPFVVVGLLAILQGIVALGIELQDAQGIGAVLLATSVGLAVFGGSADRRFTTWVGAGGAVVGIALIVLPDVDTAGVAGLLLLGAGLVVVVVSHLVAEQLDEPDELVESWRSRAPVGAGWPTAAVASAVAVPDAPVAVIDREPEWADGSTLELEPIAPPPVQPSPKRPASKPAPARKATAKRVAGAAPATSPGKKATTKKAAAESPPDPAPVTSPAKKSPTKDSHTARATKKRPPTT